MLPRTLASRVTYDDRVTREDRCPGVLRPHRAEDGLLVRLRLPGGRTTGTGLGALAGLAARFGNEELQLTSRAGLQIRGLPDPVPPGVVAEIAAAGFLPSAAHDRVRNILCSPLTGISGGQDDVADLVAELDRALMAGQALVGLPGRFLFALDDGRGDVSRLPFDLGYRASSTTGGEVLVGDGGHRIPVRRTAVVPTLVGLAGKFLRERASYAGRGWHVRDLRGWADSTAGPPARAVPAAGPGQVPLGAVAKAASVLVPLGLLTQQQAAAVAEAAGDGPLVITPWRGVIIAAAAGRLDALVATGLMAAEESGWTKVTACVGAPHCARTTLNTRAVATTLVLTNAAPERVHVSGCERRCGAPPGAHRELVGAA